MLRWVALILAAGCGGASTRTEALGRDRGSALPCRAAPFATASSYAAGDDALYAFAEGALVRIPSTGAAEPLAPAAEGRDLVVDGHELFWVLDAADRSAIVHGARDVLYEGPRVSNLAVDRERVYFFGDDRAIWSVPRTGGARTKIADDPHWPITMAGADGEFVYWSAMQEDGLANVERAPVGGGGAMVLAAWRSLSLSGQVHTARTDESFVYLFDFGSVRRVPKAGGAPVELYASTRERLAGFALAGDAIYWAIRPDSDEPRYLLSRMGKDGRDRRALFEHHGVDGPRAGLAVAHGVIYFSSPEIWRICD